MTIHVLLAERNIHLTILPTLFHCTFSHGLQLKWYFQKANMISRVFANTFQMLSITPRTWSTSFCLVWPLLLLQPHHSPAAHSSRQSRHPDLPGNFLHVHLLSFAQLSPPSWDPCTSQSFCSEFFFSPVPSCLILISYFLIWIILNTYFISLFLYHYFPFFLIPAPSPSPARPDSSHPQFHVPYMSPSKHLMQL